MELQKAARGHATLQIGHSEYYTPPRQRKAIEKYIAAPLQHPHACVAV